MRHPCVLLLLLLMVVVVVVVVLAIRDETDRSIFC